MLTSQAQILSKALVVPLLSFRLLSVILCCDPVTAVSQYSWKGLISILDSPPMGTTQKEDIFSLFLQLLFVDTFVFPSDCELLEGKRLVLFIFVTLSGSGRHPKHILHSQIPHSLIVQSLKDHYIIVNH
jgi:hypothetical protein